VLNGVEMATDEFGDEVEFSHGMMEATHFLLHTNQKEIQNTRPQL
jgi:hypothetical protein